jgi:hypothetical protein
VADLLHRLVHQRQLRLHQIGKLDVALARHRAELDRAVALLDIGEALDPVQVDDVIRQDEAHVEHRHQRLAAGEQLGVVERAEQADRLVDGFRIVVLKQRRLHCGPVANIRTSIGKRCTDEQRLPAATVGCAIAGARVALANPSSPAQASEAVGIAERT